MHEIGIVRQVLRTVEDYARENDLKEIAEIVLDVGEVSQVVPEYLTEIYPYVAEETEMFKDTKLIINMVPGMAECDDCDAIYNLVECEGICPDCGSQRKTVYSGTECTIREIHIPEESP